MNYSKEIIKSLKEYNPIIHTNKEKEYNWLKDNNCSIEIKNKDNDSLYIDLEDEITISYGLWHTHYYCEDKIDFEEALSTIENILNNKECVLLIYCNKKLFGSGSEINKEKYTLEEAIDFIDAFFNKTSVIKLFQEYGANIKVNYWDKTKNYELFIDKEYF